MQLHHGDALDLLPRIEGINSIITDPVWPKASPKLAGSTDPWKLFERFCEVLPRQLDRLTVIVSATSDVRFLRYVPEWLPFFTTAWLPYTVPNAFGRQLGGREHAYVFGRPIPYKEGQRVIPGWCKSVTYQNRHAKTEHPTPRHIDHMKYCVRWYSGEDDLVCDPFMGSGTTGVACVALGRQFVGIEIDEGHYKEAQMLIGAAERQADLFLKPTPASETALL